MKAIMQVQSSIRFAAGSVALALLTAALLLISMTSRTRSGDGWEATAREVDLPVGERSTHTCRLEFIAYEPSVWEQRWHASAEEYQQHACETMLQQKHLVDAWMEPMNATFSASYDAATEQALQNSTVVSPIELLVGLLRHPTAGPHCRRADRPEFLDLAHDPPVFKDEFLKWCANHPAVDCVQTLPLERYTLQNKGCMIMQPLPVEAIATLYPGRKYLFDSGTGRFISGSLPWFMTNFGARGIDFDEIFGWEVEHIPDDQYWGEWPPHLDHKMHFRNVPCLVEPDNPRNPFQHSAAHLQARRLCRLKLDIDNEPIEQALLSQLDDSVISMIAEFFTEIHVDIPEMRHAFGWGLTTKLPAVINKIQGFRMKGLRIHYWP